ncbi:TPA: hypothetical protein N0F65_012234 [Lagenidium giganteum]|uniref:Transmembrane protein n=1 Tax=Lagenidium giganteum TaxID=4803 RepID=A0AAV2ZEQ3_9STRA|nr:TPA: hypothetical protein N0F65_012234 [Lagenidium giganteum]
MISCVVYMLLATCLACATRGLSDMAQPNLMLGLVEEAWDHDIWDCPVLTFMQGNTTVAQATKNDALNLTTLSLGTLQYDTCGRRDGACADALRPNTERVLGLLALSFKQIPDFEVPVFATPTADIRMQYVNQLSGWNFPVVQYSIPGYNWAVVCSVRRSRYHLATEKDSNLVDSTAMCSNRAFDPDWICENEVAKNVATYIIKLERGVTTYLGKTPRGEIYYNPGNIAVLTGSVRGNGSFTTVPSTDEYNDGILQSAAPWDVCPAYLCKGTFNYDTYAGMRWQGQGKAMLTWTPGVLMQFNAITLWAMTMFYGLVQLLYLPRSSVCVIPVLMSKSLVGVGVLALACYGNYNVQVLTTYLSLNKVRSFNAEPYRLSGPLALASVIGIMSGTVIQIFFNPYLAVPSYVLTSVSVINFVIVFILEAYVFIALFFVKVGIVIVGIIRRRTSPPPAAMNGVLRLFGAKSISSLATSGVGGCVHVTPTGVVLVDTGVLVSNNFVRVSDEYAIRTSNLKYAIIFRFMPRRAAWLISTVVGRALALRTNGNTVGNQVEFRELKDMRLTETSRITSHLA